MSTIPMHKNFILFWISGILLSFCSGPLGSFMIWRKMSSFGNTLSHASLLGLAISLLFSVNTVCSVLITLIILTCIIIYVEYISNLPLDTILGITTYSSLSIGMIILHVISKDNDANLTQYLLGNILQLTLIDVSMLLILTIIVCVIIKLLWKSLLLIIIDIEFAQIQGINIFNMRLILMVLVALFIGISTTFIGALLITAILIIPPAISKKISTSPEFMVLFSILINIISITSGTLISIYYNTPISPTIILLETIIFLISLII